MFHLPNDPYFQIFRATGSSSNDWQTWRKPKGARFVTFWLLGGGGGGGAGCSGANPSTRGGGGGGGGGTMACVRIAANLLPDVLYIQVPKGGAGGTPTAGSGNAGSNGGRAYVSINKSITANSLIATNSGGNSTGGAGGTAAAGGTAGSFGSAASSSNAVFFGLGHLFSHAGTGGNAGGAHTGAAGGTVIAMSSAITSGGAGGAGCNSASDFAGGVITASSTLWGTNLAAGTANGGDGNNGRANYQPFCSHGGSGGGSDLDGTGGMGGNGEIGSGGGGGGAGLNGGAGGNGGDGLVIVMCE